MVLPNLPAISDPIPNGPFSSPPVPATFDRLFGTLVPNIQLDPDPGSPPSEEAWVRPTDWLPMPSISPSDEKFAGLFAIYNAPVNPLALQFEGDYTVDWGDGTVENFSSGVKAQHNYSWSEIPESTVTDQGYKQVIVIVTPSSGQQLTYLNIATNHDLYAGFYPVISWLDICISLPNANSGYSIVLSYGGDYDEYVPLAQRVRILNSGGATNFNQLLYFYSNLQEFYLGENSVEDMSQMFGWCRSLRNVSLLNLPSLASIDNIFYNCTALKTVEFGDLPVIESFNPGLQNNKSVTSVKVGDCPSALYFSSSFSGCRSLRSVVLGDMPLAFNFEQTFRDCNSLTSVTLGNTPSAQQMGAMFEGCSSLRQIAFSSLPGTEETLSMFAGCTSLISAEFGDMPNLLFAYNMFDNCSALKSVSFGDLPLVEDMSELFYECESLQTVTLGDLPSVTSMSYTFSRCFSLTSVTLGDTPLLSHTYYMFSEDSALVEVSPINMASVTDAGSMFDYCVGLQKGALVDTSVDIYYYGCLLSRQAIVDIFDGLANASATIDVSGNYGAADLTAEDLAIATDKGWTVIS